MNQKLIFCAMLAAGLTVAGSAAASNPQFSPRTGSGEQVMRARGQKAVSPMRISAKTPAKTPAARTMWAYGNDIVYFDQYGTLECILEEDFSKLTMGTEEQPDLKTKLEISADSPEYTYPWWNFNPEYTHEPHWGVGCAYGAGGTLYWKLDYRTMQAHFNTCLVDLSGDYGIGVLEFRARKSADSTEDYIQIEAGETHNMGPSWDVCDDAVVISNLSTEWTTYRVMFRGCGPTTLLNVVGIFTAGPYAEPEENQTMWFDDVKVYKLTPFVNMPVGRPVSDYKGTSFVANWNPVEGAEKYILTVYTVNAGTGERVVHEEADVTGTSYKVENTISGETYYYEVKAVKGGKESFPSYAQRVYCLEAPVMKAAEVTGDWTYVASWDEVQGADVYNYMAYDEREASADGEFVVTAEDFTGVLDADGYPTGNTKEDPWDQCYEEYYCEQLKQQGWVGKNCCPYDDYLAFDAFFYTTGQGDSGFISPEMDLSKDGGKFTVTGDFAGDEEQLEDQAGRPVIVYTQTCVALFNWNDARGDYDQVELVYPEVDVVDDWQTLSFEFTKGSERSIIGIYAIGSYANLYLDNLKITQNYKKGDKLMEPFLYKRFYGSKEGQDPKNRIEVEVPGHATGYNVYHKVSAFSRQADKYGQSYDDRESEYSELMFVTRTISGVDNVVEVGEATVSLAGSTLTVVNPNGEKVRVFGLNGMLLNESSEAVVTTELQDAGVYVAKVGNKAVKVVK